MNRALEGFGGHCNIYDWCFCCADDRQGTSAAKALKVFE